MKVHGSYASVVRGVSQQVPQDRFPGQHNEQINLVSDPVRGLARRHGTRIVGEIKVRDTVVDFPAAAEDIKRMGQIGIRVEDKEYDIMYRTQASTRGAADFIYCYDKTQSTYLSTVLAPDDAPLTELLAGGVSASTQLGKYILFAGNTVAPVYETYDAWANSQYRAVAWVRAGAYSRTYRVVVTITRFNGSQESWEVSHTTLSSSYPGVLDTSDIPANVPESVGSETLVPNIYYQELVNNRTNEYNTAVTQWIGDAAASIQPQNIAAAIGTGFINSAPFTAEIDVAWTSSTIGFVAKSPDAVLSMQVYDGGDGTQLRGVADAVTAADLVSTVHYPNKVVKVTPKKYDQSDAYYLRAVAIRPGSPEGALTEVRWIETAGVMNTPTTVFILGIVDNGTLYLASNSTKLAEILPGEHPSYEANQVGDDASAPIPKFFGRRITYLGMFQDRLVIASGSVVLFSRSGDYFNWYRQSVLADSDSDPIEAYALGSEDDTITHGTTFDRNLILFGKNYQYSISGRTILTPRTASIQVMSSHEDAMDAPPVNAGNLAYYAKHANGKTSVHQFQLGLVADSPESYEISRPLDDYIEGRPVSITAITAPNHIIVRTDTERNTLFVYNYLDTPATQERVFDAWSKWQYDPICGVVIGITVHDGDLVIHWLRTGQDSEGAVGTWLVADRQPIDTRISDLPYLDSARIYSDRGVDKWEPATIDKQAIAFPLDHERSLLGIQLEKAEEIFDEFPGAEDDVWVGLDFGDNTFVSPTNPYMRDRNDKAISTGRLTLSRVVVSVAQTGGMSAWVTTANGTKRAVDFVGRLVGRSPNVIGSQPTETTTVAFMVGRSTTACTYEIRAHKWLPLTVTALEWVGQYFSSGRRV